MKRRFALVDVFAAPGAAFAGNPLAVVLDSEGLDDATMQRIARWLNLSETTFVLPPTMADADYRVRIFTPVLELPFAGHPTLGTAHAWLAVSPSTIAPEMVGQECGAGLVAVRRTDAGLAFAAPPLLRSGPVEPSVVAEVTGAFGIDAASVVAAEWVDNGPGWLALLLGSAEDVLAVRPGFVEQDVGVVGLCPPGSSCAIEVRAFFPKDGVMVEDPVTGSLNASVAQWLTGSGRLTLPYVASQGTALRRTGRVHLTGGDDGGIWVGGATTTLVEGTLDV